MIWRFRGRVFDLTSRGLIVGILNVTPDSFSDGGKFLRRTEAVLHARKLEQEGADLLDIGGESTRPGASGVDACEEVRRLLPVLEALHGKLSIPISVDTSKSSVARAALDAGAEIINDVTALCGDDGMGPLVASRGAGLILMHMQGAPATMQESPAYPGNDALHAVVKFLSERRDAAISYGVDPAAIVLDPGLGFGKTEAHNLSLLRGLPLLSEMGSPVMIGHSRKSFLGQAGCTDSTELRRNRGVTTTAVARALGARLFRVHDVPPHLEALRMSEAILNAS
jgi:dihydropteroate synthase